MRFLQLAALLLPALAFAQTPAKTPPTGAAPAEELKVADGFKVELLRSATKEEGSWICMAIDPRGRLYISCQGKPPGAGMKREDAWGGLSRVTRNDPANNKSTSQPIEKWEQVPLPPGLLATLSQEEVLDLVAYLQSGGNEKAPNFAN